MCALQVMGRSGAGKTTLVRSLCVPKLVQDCSALCFFFQAARIYMLMQSRWTLSSAFAVSSSAPDSQTHLTPAAVLHHSWTYWLQTRPAGGWWVMSC